MKRSSRGSQLAKVTTYRRVPGAFGVRERRSPSDHRGSPRARVARAARAASRARAASGAWNRARPITRARALPGGRRSNVTSHEGAARVTERFRSSKRSVVTAPPLLPAISVAIEKREEAGWRRSPRARPGPSGPSREGLERVFGRLHPPHATVGWSRSGNDPASKPEGRGLRQLAPHRAFPPEAERGWRWERPAQVGLSSPRPWRSIVAVAGPAAPARVTRGRGRGARQGAP
jgi:hypothetical protein